MVTKSSSSLEEAIRNAKPRREQRPKLLGRHTSGGKLSRTGIERNRERMGLTKDFRKTTYARAQRDGSFRKALLTEAINAYLSGEETIGKAILKDFINSTIGFEKLACN